MNGPESAVTVPSGTVTFLFTDVEGSTRLWAADKEAMSASLLVHDGILRGAIEGHGGYVFTTAGDSFAAAFGRASDAVGAAVAIQAGLVAASWPGPALRVRMGLHLGEAEERGGDYFGPVVNTTARVEAAGHGGQTLITEPVRIAASVTDVTDLGVHQLRDVDEPLRLFQVGGGDFGTLRGLVGVRDSLPARRTRLLGRDTAIAQLRSLLVSERLVTLVGPGGIGKTSLAVETVGQLSGRFVGGVHFADLASITNPDDITAAICRGVQLVVTTAPYEQLVSFLRRAECLVIIDNCEHLIDAAAEMIDRLLSDVASLTLLATSREHLDVDGERVVRVEPLASDVGSAAVRLFVERVVAVAPEFDPGPADLERISQICARLDGLPLAIELAAGRARSMSVAEIEAGLADRFELLAGGRRGKLRRQQTIRAAIEWSIELLEPGERDVLARSAVFPGAFSLTGATAVGGLNQTATSRVVSSLTAKSLVQRGGDVAGEARFHLLETIREWGLEDLVRRDLLARVRDAHAHWHLSVAEAMTTTEFMASSIFRHDDAKVIDVVAAAVRLRERDIEGAAILVSTHAWVLVETGAGPQARELIEESFAHGWTRLPSRQFAGRCMLAAAMMESYYDFPPPPDDGSFGWRYLVGGKEHDNAGILGNKRLFESPQRVIDQARARPPVRPDSESRLIRALGTAIGGEAFTALGSFEEAIAAFEESRRLFALVGTIPAWPSDVLSVATAALCLGVDLRDTVAAHEIQHRQGNTVIDRFIESIVLSAPADRYLAVATAARDHSHGRWPGEESLFLAVLGFYALADGDTDRARFLSDSVEVRSPATFALKRHNLIRAQGEPLDLIADQQHHRQALLATLGQADVRELNRTKLRNELDRIFASTNTSHGSVA